MWKTHNIYTLLHDKVLATLGTMRADQCVTGDTLSPTYLELNNSKLKHSSEALSSKHFKNTKDKNTKTQELKRLKQLDEVWSVISKAS